MDFLVYILILALFVWFRNSILSELKRLTREVHFLRDAIKQYEKQGKHEVKPETQAKEPTAEKTSQPVPQKVILPKVKEEIFVRKENPVEEFKQERIAAPGKTEQVFEKKIYTSPKPSPSFFERYPDLEKFIGENLINKIGIAILVLGIGYFVKYAIDKNWINEIGRVGIGVLAGGILIGLAHRLHKTFKAFSSVLVGGGLSVLYFTIAIGFHEYHIFSQATAFIIMIVITGFAVALSVAYNRIELAVLALIGGFSSPFIVSTGEGNYKVLFTYLLILNGGMLVLAYIKKWNLVNILCYAFTVLIYGSWLVTKCLNFPNAPYGGAMIFGATFYIVFFLMNIIYNIKNKIPFKAFEIGMLLSNTALFYAAGMSILHYYFEGRYQGVFTALIGIFNFGFAFAFYRNKSIHRNLIFLLIGLVLTFLSLTAPIQLEGNYITLFWAIESVLLLWFSQKSGIKLIRGTSVAVTLLMLISLLMDWLSLYYDSASTILPVLINKAFITSFVSLISVFASIKLLNNEADIYFLPGKFTLAAFKIILRIVFVTILYLMFLQEINYQMVQSGYNHHARNISLGVYNFAFLGIAYLFFRRRITYNLSTVFFITSGILLLAFIGIYNSSIIAIRNNFLEDHENGFFFMLHFLLAGLVAVVVYIFNQSSYKIMNEKNTDWIKWITVILIVYICSAELNHLVSLLSYSPGRIIYQINKQVFKAGYSVLWGLISLLLMQQGMKRKDRVLRIISLSLFFITILKLFISDIRGISEAGKIGAFISLGVLLLVVSFMYQRLKRLILEDEVSAGIPAPKNADEN
jgi:uncharacterized membrane protein